MFTLLELCASCLRRGHANLLCIVPILTDDPRRESNNVLLFRYVMLQIPISKGDTPCELSRLAWVVCFNLQIAIRVYIYIYIYLHIPRGILGGY